jgi:dGTPase
MTDTLAEALTEFRRFNYDQIYMRAESLAQSATVIRILRALVEHHGSHPDQLPALQATGAALESDSAEALAQAVTYVGGMTDRYAFSQAQQLLGWNSNDLPVGIL